MMRVRRISWHKSSHVVVCQKNFNLRPAVSCCSKEKRNGTGHISVIVRSLFRTHGTAISELAKRHIMNMWTSGQKCFFNDEYLINYSTDHITTKPIRKIDLELSSYLFNFNNILTKITIKTNGK